MTDTRTNSGVSADAETIFVLGNGPSLAEVSLPKLSGFATVGMNAAYRYWREIDWRPKFYACLDTVVGLSHSCAIAELIEEERIEKFFLRENLIAELGALGESERLVSYEALSEREPALSVLPITTGSHSALWAALMGYRQIVLLGVDLQYKEIIDGARRRDGIELEIVEECDNPNYFFKGYQQPGDRYNVPNPRPDLHVEAWRKAARIIKGLDGAPQVFQANPQSAVQVFDTVDFGKFLAGLTSAIPAREKVTPLSVAQLINERTTGDANPPGVDAFACLYGFPVFALVGVCASVVLGCLLIFGVGPAAAAAGFLGLALGIANLVLLLYTRFRIINHLQCIERANIGAAARLRILEARDRRP